MLLRLVPLLVLFGCAIALLGTRDYGGGVDGGIHYAIADWLSLHLIWPFPKTAFLGWISHYPPGAHLLAAGFGMLAGSPVHGLFIVTAISVVVFYLVAAELMKDSSPVRTLCAFAVFILLAFATRRFLFLTGNEMLINFFFAQLAGNAALMAGFYLAYLMIDAPFRRWLAMTAIATHLVGWLYPLSAIELAIAAAVLRGTPMAPLRSDVRKRLAETAIALLVLCAAAFIHPAMIGMAGISANDGGISIANNTIWAIVIGAVILIPVFLVLFMGRGSVNAGAIFALALGALAPCAGLGLLYAFGLGGSLYAVKKSGFLLGTVTCMMLSVVVVEAVFRVVRQDAGWLARLARISQAQTVMGSCLFAAIVILSVFYGRKSEPVANLAAYDRDVRQLLSQDTSDQLYGATLSMNSSVSPHINFVVGYALLRQTVATAVQHQLFFSDRPDLAGIKFVLVNKSDESRYDRNCVTSSSERLVVIRPECVIPKPQTAPVTRQ